MKTKAKNKIKRAWFKIPDTVRIAMIVLVLVFPAWVIFAALVRRCLTAFGEGLLIEAFGMLLDVLIIGIIILWLNERRENKRRIERWQEEIDDIRYWKSKEAMYRIVGIIKRLNRNGITKINLRYCYLENADLTGTDLHGAFLQFANLKNAIYYEAKLKGSFLQRAKLQEVSFNEANFQGVKFFNADLTGASLLNAEFQDANLKDINLQGACLIGAKNLTIEQLSKVKTLYRAKLDPKLENQVKEKYPHLLEEPKPEKEGQKKEE